MTEAGLPPAAILAGGLGTRISAVGGATPKVLLPVEGRPFIGHLLDYLAGHGVKRAVLCLGHAADAVWDAAQTEANGAIELVLSREEEPLGTGGALRLATEHLPETFFVLNGDTLVDAPLAELWTQHRSRTAALTLSLVRSDRASEKGSVRVSPDGTVLRFDEKIVDGTGLINAGVYVMQREVVSGGAGPVSLEREIIPALLGRGETVTAKIVSAPFVDIGLPEDYLAVKDRLPRR